MNPPTEAPNPLGRQAVDLLAGTGPGQAKAQPLGMPTFEAEVQGLRSWTVPKFHCTHGGTLSPFLLLVLPVATLIAMIPLVITNSRRA